MKAKKKRCGCELCKLGRVMERISKKCTKAEQRALEALWDRMENAEVDLAMTSPRLEKEIAEGRCKPEQWSVSMTEWKTEVL